MTAICQGAPSRRHALARAVSRTAGSFSVERTSFKSSHPSSPAWHTAHAAAWRTRGDGSPSPPAASARPPGPSRPAASMTWRRTAGAESPRYPVSSGIAVGSIVEAKTRTARSLTWGDGSSNMVTAIGTSIDQRSRAVAR